MIDKLLQAEQAVVFIIISFWKPMLFRRVPDNIDASLEFMKVSSLELGFICWLHQCSAQMFGYFLRQISKFR